MKTKSEAFKEIKKIIEDNDCIEDSLKFDVLLNEIGEIKILVRDERKIRIVAIDIVNRVNENKDGFCLSDRSITMTFEKLQNQSLLSDSFNLYRVYKIWFEVFHNNKAVHHEG